MSPVVPGGMGMRVALIVVLSALAFPGCGSNPTEPAPSCSYTLSTSTISAGAQGGSGTVTVTTSSTCTWSAQSGAQWITISGAASGTGTGTVSYTIASNADTTARISSLTIAGQSVTVNQQGLACTYTLSPSSLSFDSSGGTGSFEVAAPGTCQWTAAANASWVTVVSGSSGSGAGTVRLSVSPNASPEARSAAINVSGSTFTISQSGTSGCSYTIAPDDDDFGVAGGTGTVTLTTSSGCAWTARSNVAWIHVAAPANGQGTGSQVLSYVVDANPGADSREGTVLIGDRTLVVTQAGTKACEYSVSPVSVSACVGSLDRSVEVSTQPACPWTASVNVDWLSIASGENGRGPGTIRFRAPDNYSGAARTGLVMVRWPTQTEGQNVQVTQSGCLYAVAGATAFGSAGGSGRLSVYSMPDPYCGGPFGDVCVWTARSDVAWITITTPMPRNGDDDVSFTVAANDGTQARSGTITIASKVVVITQAGR